MKSTVYHHFIEALHSHALTNIYNVTGYVNLCKMIVDARHWNQKYTTVLTEGMPFDLVKWAFE